MRIARFTEYASPSLGGYPTNEFLICKGLAELGHDVTLYTSTALPGRYLLKHRNFDDEDMRPSFKLVASDALVTLGGDAPLIPSLVVKAWNLDAEIVHAHEAYQPSSLVAWYLSRRTGAAFTFSQERYYAAKRRAWKLPLWLMNKFVTPWVHRQARMATAFSAAAAEYLAARGYPSNRIKIIPMCIDLAKFEGPRSSWLRKRLGARKEPVILSVARLHKSKGLAYLLAAISKAKKFRPEIKLVIIGRGPEERNLRGLAGRLGLGASVNFLTEFVPHSELASAYFEADLFVLPSLYETFGVAVVEAMASGKAVVASDVGGLRDVVNDGQTGFKVKPSDIEGLADKILMLLNDPALRESLGRNARRSAAQYDWKILARKYETYYEELTHLN